MTVSIRLAKPDEIDELIVPLSHAFGFAVTPERTARLRGVPELDLHIGAWDDGLIVGSAGAFTFRMTVPGGVPVEISGLTIVSVLATHRRRGILTSMMRAHLDEAHRRGHVVASLFASEGAIYGRFGYGLASLSCAIELDREHAAFTGTGDREGRARIVRDNEADLPTLQAIWDRARRQRPGMLSRSLPWWRIRRLGDAEWMRAGRGPLQRVILELDGRPAAYALYRYTLVEESNAVTGTLDVTEAVGDSPAATRAIWRYLADVDTVHKIKAVLLPVDHPLFFLLPEARRLRARITDTLYVRLVDAGAALAKRRYGAGGPLVLELDDPLCPWNQGRWKIADGAVTRTDDPADLALDAAALGSVYLGAFGFTQLASAGRVRELSPGALARGDALFRSADAPWCPEQF